MLLINNRGFKKQYVYGGSSIFAPIANLASRIMSKEAAKRLASQALQSAATHTGKKLAEKAIDKVMSKSSSLNKPEITAKSQDILSKDAAPKEDFNLNSLIAGSALTSPINIKDYMKKLRLQQQIY